MSRDDVVSAYMSNAVASGRANISHSGEPGELRCAVMPIDHGRFLVASWDEASNTSGGMWKLNGALMTPLTPKETKDMLRIMGRDTDNGILDLANKQETT